MSILLDTEKLVAFMVVIKLSLNITLFNFYSYHMRLTAPKTYYVLISDGNGQLTLHVTSPTDVNEELQGISDSLALPPTSCRCFLSLLLRAPGRRFSTNSTGESSPSACQGLNPLEVTFQPREERAIELCNSLDL